MASFDASFPLEMDNDLGGFLWRCSAIYAAALGTGAES